jgi:predicted permease
MFRRLFARLFGGNRREPVFSALDEELQFHLAQEIQAHLDRGRSPAEARRLALRDLGGVTQTAEAVRDVRAGVVGRWADDFRKDLRYAARAFWHQPGFSVVAVCILTIGIGANAGIFSVVNAVLLRPLPVRDPTRLVLFSGDTSQGDRTSTPFPEGVWKFFSTDAYVSLREALAPKMAVAAFASGDFVTTLRLPGASNDAARRVETKFVSGSYFEVMGASASLGRTLTADDDQPQAAPVAVASDQFWRANLSADPLAVGRRAVVDGVALTIVGVMPKTFFGERVRTAPDLWVPLVRRDPAVRERSDYYWLGLIARLGPGQTIGGAQTSAELALRRFLEAQVEPPLSADTRHRIDGVRLEMADGALGISTVRQNQSRLLMLLLSAVGLTLLTACANVATLFLARTAAREREIAVRRALGASRARLIRQWLTESLILGGAGAVGGVGLAWAAGPMLLAELVPNGRGPIEATMDGTVLAFAVTITIGACLLFGLTPALSAGASIQSARYARRDEASGGARSSAWPSHSSWRKSRCPWCS